ncbi:unnamed protein product [Schistocephalus solidus]|uniref:Uncharacterized protein n=1 Tax=Schistocephalus solidus TaxID=70667 RepID=A0A183SJG3_SCHSO|nr:unnamed protein product [Schistocephalus solidus]
MHDHKLAVSCGNGAAHTYETGHELNFAATTIITHARTKTSRGTPRTARVSLLTLAAWNFRSLLDNPRSNQPERRAVLVTLELAHYKVEIAALSETRLSEHGQLEEVGAGYTFFRSGRPKAERRDAGVAFAIRIDIVGRLPCLP